MEVKINKDIPEFSESIFFGLSLRQFIFSILACAVGFIKYNGMNAEEFVIAFIKSEILTPRELKFSATNIYAEEFKGIIDKKLKQGILKPQKKNKERKIKKPKKAKKSKEVEANAENT